jgi:hypothetical protein
MVEPVRAFLLSLCCVLVAVGRLAAAQPTPLVVEADRIAYDTVARTVEASGRVRLRYGDLVASADYLFADLVAGEVLLRGNVRAARADQRVAAEEVRYRLDLGEGWATDVQAVADRAYLRARRLELGRDRLVAQDALATLCDPQSPLFHVTAQRIAVFPGQRLVAEGASLWVGGARILTLPRYEVRLESPERVSQSFPSPELGFDALSGYWIALRYPYRLGDVEAEAYARYNTGIGFEIRNTLRAGLLGGTAQLTTGTVRDSEGRPVDLAELRYTSGPWRIGDLASSLALAAGQYRERVTGAESPRFEAVVEARSPTWRLGDRWSVDGSGGLRHSAYRDRALSVPTLTVSVAYATAPHAAAYLSYAWTEAYGSTPFLFDAPTRQSAVTLGYRQARDGLAFDLGVQYDAALQHLRLLASLQAALGDGWRVRTFAKYNSTLAVLEELDLQVGRLCDCLDLNVTYRVPQGQFWVTVNMVPSPRVREAVPPPAP